ncbi:MAG TPA: DUF5666 domain-containing protein [Candidatus Binatia bacterium]|nr:DUF5666 domain-containing protein [Candidatus Binatia bacterium]
MATSSAPAVRRERAIARITLALAALLVAMPSESMAASPCATGGLPERSGVGRTEPAPGESGIAGTGRSESGIAGTGRSREPGLGGSGRHAGDAAGTVAGGQSGIGGTGRSASGIAGTGSGQSGTGATGRSDAIVEDGPGSEESGIGGTGHSRAVLGTVTGFASVCVGGIEIQVDDLASLGAAPSIGDVVEVVGDGRGDSVRARSVRLHHIVAGPIDGVDERDNALRVLGQRIVLSGRTRTRDGGAERAATAADFDEGASVRVSGLRRADGSIEATRIEIAAGDEVTLTGRLDEVSKKRTHRLGERRSGHARVRRPIRARRRGLGTRQLGRPADRRVGAGGGVRIARCGRAVRARRGGLRHHRGRSSAHGALADLAFRTRARCGRQWNTHAGACGRASRR